MRFCSPLVFFEKLEENFQIDGIPYQRIDYTCQGGLDKYTLSGVNIMKISYIAPERVYFFLLLTSLFSFIDTLHNKTAVIAFYRG